MKRQLSKIKNYWSQATILLLILVFAFSIRLFQLDESPKGALIDEAHFGYLAWSILETGKDEHGVPFPLNFKGFGDDKLPLQVYLLVPIVKFFGLSNATIRYPSVLLGSLLTLLMYFLSRRSGFTHQWALLAAFITAISPWPFILSRFGFESNIALFFFTLGLIFLMSFLRNGKKYFLLGWAVCFAVTWYAYIAYRPITIGFFILTVLSLRFIKKITTKQLLGFVLIFVVAIIPLFQRSVIGNNSTRLSQVGIFHEPSLALEVNEFRSFCVSYLYQPKLCYLVSNKYVVAFRFLLNRYLEAFSPNFLGTHGESNEKFLTAENAGQFASILYPFFIIGFVRLIIVCIEDWNEKRASHQFLISSLILFGLLLTPIPSILAGDPQKVRISAFYPFVVLTMMLGMSWLYNTIKVKKIFKQLTVLLILGVLFIQSAQFLTNWFGVHTLKHGDMYQSYLPKLFRYLQPQLENPDTHVYVKPFFSDPIMFYAYYTHYDPAKYQQLAKLGVKEASGFQHTVQLENFFVTQVSLGEIGCQAILTGQRTLYITSEKIEGANVAFSVYSENGVDPMVFVYNAPLSVDPKKCAAIQ
ncbi:MAG: glycosyltransferase family 39 protein [Patescibacteria group bacterium]